MKITLQCLKVLETISRLPTNHVAAFVAEEASELFFRNPLQLVSRVSVDTCASETLSVSLRNARIDCATHVIVMCKPPSSCFGTLLDDVSNVLLIAAAHPKETIVCGDFSTIYKYSTCTDAINQEDLRDTSGFVQHVSSATHERCNMLDLIITAKTFDLLSIPVSTTTLLIDHYVLECGLNVVKPERPKRRVFYRTFASIDKRALNTDIRNAIALAPGTTVESIDNYNTAIEIIVNKYALVIIVSSVLHVSLWLDEDQRAGVGTITNRTRYFDILVVYMGK